MQKNRKSRIPEFVLVVFVLVSGTMLGFSSKGFIINFKSAGFSIVSTFQMGLHSCVDGIGSVFTALRQLADLKKENEILREKVKNYEILQRTNVEIKKENDRLKGQLDFSQKLEQKNYPAQIIGRNADNLFSGLTINKGSRNGIKKNMPVLAIQNGTAGLVGKVVSVGLFTSVVMPVYDSKCTISCRIQNTRDIGLVSGLGNEETDLRMLYIKKRVLDELHIGDVVVTSGENQNYIADIPVGTISKISVLEYNSSLSIDILPVVNFARLENVIVTDLKELNNISGEKND